MSVSLSTPRTIQGAAAGRRTQLAVAIGHEPALDPTGQQDPHERQALNVRWLAGTVLTRDYKGQTLQVRVLASGFEYEGEVYRSLSAVAKQITGTHTNGFLFFRLRKEDQR